MPIYICEADKNTVVHFGHGDVVVSTSLGVTATASEVVITPSVRGSGPLGDRTEQFDGKSTSEIPPGVRLIFDDPLSVMVLIDALSSVAQAMFSKVKPRLADYAELCRENRQLHQMVELSKAVEADRAARVPEGVTLRE